MAEYKNASAQLRQFWASRNGRQRAFLIGGALGTGLLLALFVRLIATPDYKQLYTGLEAADAQALGARLDQQGIPHQLSPDGKTLSVPADKLDAARMQTASEGEPRSGRMGFELFDKSSWGQTEFDEKVAYQRALEGELGRSIQTLSDVESARVHLVMPSDSVFLDRQRGAKASVVLKLRRGTLSKSAAVAISRLVAGAVDDLKPEDVAIVDADSDRSLGIGQDGEDAAGGSTDLTNRLISTLEPVVGTGKIRASVNVDYDRVTTDESQEKYDPSSTAVLSDQKTEEQAGGDAVSSGVPGATSNVPSAKQSKPATTPSTQRSTTETAQYGVNRTVVHTVTPAGQIQRITAAILVDDEMVKSVENGKTRYTRRKRSPQELNQIKDLAEAVIGFDAKRGDSITVQNLSFDSNLQDLDVPAASWASQVEKAVLDYSSLLRPVSLLVLFVLVYRFVIRPVQKHVLSFAPAVPRAEPLLPNEHMESLPGVTAELSSVRAAQLKEQTLQTLRQNPVHATRAVQAWLREEPS